MFISPRAALFVQMHCSGLLMTVVNSIMNGAQQMLCESCWCADGKVFMAIIRKLFWRLLYGCGSWQWSLICLSERLYSPARTTISTKEHELKHNPAQSVFFLTVDNEADLHDSQSHSRSHYRFSSFSASHEKLLLFLPLELSQISVWTHTVSAAPRSCCVFIWELQEKHLML